MVEKYVTNGIFNSVEEREWLAFFEEEERTASAYDNVVETVYDRNDGELKGTPLMQNRKKKAKPNCCHIYSNSFFRLLENWCHKNRLNDKTT